MIDMTVKQILPAVIEYTGTTVRYHSVPESG